MKRGVIISVLLHVALLSMLFVGFLKYVKAPDSSNPDAEIIESYSVDASTLQVNKPKPEPEPPKPEPKPKPEPEITKATPPIKKPKLIEDTQKFEEELKAQKAKKLALEKKIQAEISLKRKREKEQQEKKIKLRRLELKKKKQAALKKKQQEQERKKKAEAKKQYKLKQERLKQEKLKQEKIKKARKAKLAEKERLLAARRKAALEAGAAKERALTNSIISRYSGLIKQKMERNWRRPADSRSLICTTRIKLLPDGSVLDVKIIRSSGSNSFDGSVIDALYNAGTFPLPRQPKYRAMFVDDDLIMKFTNSR